MKVLTKEIGITLIALVVTVIILLIIAGVAVSMITGNDGLFSKANVAGTRYNESAQNEANEISQMLEWGESKIPADADLVIATVEDFIAFRDSVNAGNTYKNKKVYLIDDIDLSSVCSAILGSFEQIGVPGVAYFQGTFDGMKHTISNLYINSDKNYMTGLFTRNYGTIQNLVLDNFYVRNARTSEATYTGAITGVNSGNCSIIACALTNGKLYVDGPASKYIRYVGGIVGWNPGSIEQCYNASYIYATNNSTSAANYQVRIGGIVGETEKLVKDCYNTGEVVAGNGTYTIAGGIASVNRNNGHIENCYSAGIAKANAGTYKCIGGVIGLNGFYTETTRDTPPNVYCLNNSAIYNNAVKGNANSWTAVKTGVLSSSDGLKSDTVLTALGSAFVRDEKGINNGYPILAWQVAK